MNSRVIIPRLEEQIKNMRNKITRLEKLTSDLEGELPTT